MARFIEFKKEVRVIEESKQMKIENEIDKQMAEKIEKLVIDTTRLIENFDFNNAAQNLYDFAWHEFADKYIEDVKNRIDDNSFYVLTSSFLTILKLLHPFMPFVTEEIYQRLWNTGDYLMVSKWPVYEKS